MDIVLGVDEYRTARSPDNLHSGGLGPCVAVGAVYRDKGYMSHDYSMSTLPKLTQLVMDLHREVKIGSELKIFVAGGGIDSSMIEGADGILKTRQDVLNQLANFSGNVHVMWSYGNITQSLEIRVGERKAVYTTIEDVTGEEGENIFDM